jgi:acetyl-CoA C-acetyltransferase
MGALTKYTAVDLGVAAAKSALASVDVSKIDQVIVGNILSAGQGMNIARQISVGVGIPLDRIAYTVNMMCASGMQSIILAAQTILAGQAKAILCGGAESMSNAPYLLDRARGGYKLGDGTLIDSILRDGLTDTFSKTHMGLTAERLAEQYGITRAEQDVFALESQSKYGRAHTAGRFADELAALKELDKDEHPRPETTIEQLSQLRPAFKKEGTVTAGNSSGINDGAAMLIVCDEVTASKNGWQPLAWIDGWAAVGCDPQLMGLGPVYAVRKLCEQVSMQVSDFDVVELNEAFAAQSLAGIRELGFSREQVNPDGGAIALGHPIGASGARIVTHLAHRIAQGTFKKGLATLCVGGGMGVAVALSQA